MEGIGMGARRKNIFLKAIHHIRQVKRQASVVIAALLLCLLCVLNVTMATETTASTALDASALVRIAVTSDVKR